MTTFTAPAAWAGYLVNDDPQGLALEELAEASALRVMHRGTGHAIVSCGEEFTGRWHGQTCLLVEYDVLATDLPRVTLQQWLTQHGEDQDTLRDRMEMQMTGQWDSDEACVVCGELDSRKLEAYTEAEFEYDCRDGLLARLLYRCTTCGAMYRVRMRAEEVSFVSDVLMNPGYVAQQRAEEQREAEQQQQTNEGVTG